MLESQARATTRAGRWIRRVDGAGDSDLVSSLGGKGAKLAWLRQHGFRTPDTWVVTVDAFAAMLRALPPACEPRSLLRSATGRAGYGRASEARDAIATAALPSGLGDELAELWRELEPVSPWGLAVRSSATCEDALASSMAGIAESRLGVRGAVDLADAVRAVWASVASSRALAYLASRGVRDFAMAVVLQPVVRARASGVLFTSEPGRGGSGGERRVVNSAFGLGTAVVDGSMSPDLLRFDRQGRSVDLTLAHKATRVVVDGGGLSVVPVAAPDAPSLLDGDVAELARVATRLEELGPGPWDVEFACDDAGALWITQARAVTRDAVVAGGDADTVWSSANVGEALPGVATPLTWSVAGAYSETGFRRAFATLGCRVSRSSRLVGNVAGRFYLNLSQFMRIAAQVPWLDPRTLVELGGGHGGDDLAAQVSDVSRRGFYLRLPITAARLAEEQLRIDDVVMRFEREAERFVRTHASLDLEILPDAALAKRLVAVQDLLAETGDVMLTCASSSLGTHLVLERILGRVAPIGGGRLAQTLVRGIRDLESARPGIAIMQVARLVADDADLRAAIEAGAITSLDEIGEGPAKRALVRFLDLYGDRAVREVELSTPRWREDLETVLGLVRVALRSGSKDVEAQIARARESAVAEMARLRPRLGIVEQSLVRHLVARAQKAARLRERMRAWVTRVLGMLRAVALAVNARLLRLCPELVALDRAPVSAAAPPIESVFFLTIEEILDTLSQTRADFVPLVRARRAEYARDLARPDPPATFTGFPPPVVLPPAAGPAIEGTAASPGVVEGPARVLRSIDAMDELEPGEILVVHSTDVGWTPLFLVAAGVVTELGGPLSHAAIVAREFGVPSVVNAAGATVVLRTGDRVRVDGDRGRVEKLER